MYLPAKNLILSTLRSIPWHLSIGFIVNRYELKAIDLMWSLIFKCTVYHFLELGHNASVAFVWPNVITLIPIVLLKKKYNLWFARRENVHLLLKGTVHQSKINYSPSCCSNSIWFVSSLEQKLDVLKNFHTAVRWLCVIDMLVFKLHSLWSPFTSIVWKRQR